MPAHEEITALDRLCEDFEKFDRRGATDAGVAGFGAERRLFEYGAKSFLGERARIKFVENELGVTVGADVF